MASSSRIQRIPAQDSVFLIGDVTMLYAGDNSTYYRNGRGPAASPPGFWRTADGDLLDTKSVGPTSAQKLCAMFVNRL